MGTATHVVSRSSADFRLLSLGLLQVLFVTEEKIRDGDQVVVRERRTARADEPDAPEHTELWLCRRVTHCLSSHDCFAIHPGWQALSFNTAAENEWYSALVKRQLQRAIEAGATADEFWRAFPQREQNRARLDARAGL